jgi:hypothetical protein
MQEIKSTNTEKESALAVEIQEENEAPDFEIINVEGCLSSMAPIPPHR